MSEINLDFLNDLTTINDYDYDKPKIMFYALLNQMVKMSTQATVFQMHWESCATSKKI